jgi:tRNA-specific 2-thiouridylase
MSLPTDATVVVGMSGGVDSSVSALLLKQQGYQVIGLFMHNWEEENEQGSCQAILDYEDVVRVCDKIGIPSYSVNFAKEYEKSVFRSFLKEYSEGHTPNPDILCNREIKFKVLMERAVQLGADALATGHYCRIGGMPEEPTLLKGIDPAKDQSYFLYAINPKVLSCISFPIGHLTKRKVREIATSYCLPTATKKDSTGICFIGKRKFRDFLSSYLAIRMGDFEDLEGRVLGKHQGVAYYTIGQRQGLGIGGAGEAWYVVGKDPSRNVVKLAQGARHPALYTDSLIADELCWLCPKGQPKLPFRCHAKIRYRQEDQECTIVEENKGLIRVIFSQPQRAVTPRQSIVFYVEDRCIGGGMIKKGDQTYFEKGIALPMFVSL